VWITKARVWTKLIACVGMHVSLVKLDGLRWIMDPLI
jgi:hypothetical protein